MRNDENSYREKGRAVFLAAIMVLSVVAMSVALSGAAAAQPSANVDYEPDNPWQGQDVIAFGEDINNIDDPGDEEYDLRSVDSFDSDEVESSTFVEELSPEQASEDTADRFAGVDEDDWIVVVDTDDLDADDYFLRGGDLPRNPGAEDTFEVRIQDLDAEFDDSNVTDSGPDSTTDLEIESTRGTYYMNTSADGDLEYDDLFSTAVDNDAEVQASDLDDVSGIDLDGDNGDSLGEVIEENDDLDDRKDFAQLLFDSEESVEDGGPLLTGDDIEDLEFGDLDPDDGFHIFGEYATALYLDGEDDSTADADEKVGFLTGNDVDDEVDFDGIDDDTYEFNFNVTDTEASDNQTITVSDSDASANFDEGVYTQSAGDVQEFEVELEDTDDTYIQFGDEEAGFIDILYLEDDDDSGSVNFTVNTRLIGTDHTEFDDGDLTADDVFYSEDDIVESLIHHGYGDDDLNEGFDQDYHFFEDSDVEDDDAFGDAGELEDQFQGYLEELDLISEDDDDPRTQLTRPAQPTDYDLTADEQGLFIADGGESDVDDEIGFATLDLMEPELGDINTWVGPSEDADEYDDISDLVDQLTERDTVAIEDSLVIQAEASGMYGLLSAFDQQENGNDLGDGFEDGFEANTLAEVDGYDYEGISITVEDEDPIGNQDENRLDFANADDDEIFALVDNDNGELFIVVDTDASDAFTERDPADGDEFSAEIEYEVEEDRARFTDHDDGDAFDPEVSGDGDGNDDAYPYLGAGDSLSASTSFTFEDAEVFWDNVDDDGNVELEIDDNATISGETNIAPGSDVTQRVRHAGNTSSFLNNVDTEIDSDGSFEGTTDFSNRDVDDEARITFRLAGSTIDTGDGIFVEGFGVEDDDDADDDDVEVDDDADDDVEMDDDVEEPTDDDDEQPGFGVAVALVALLAAAMLALRRRD